MQLQHGASYFDYFDVDIFKNILFFSLQKRVRVSNIMSKFERVKQWAAFSRNWHIYDAKWQNPFTSAKAITKVMPRKPDILT